MNDQWYRQYLTSKVRVILEKRVLESAMCYDCRKVGSRGATLNDKAFGQIGRETFREFSNLQGN